MDRSLRKSEKQKRAKADLDQQDLVKQQVLEAVSTIAVTAASGGFNWTALIPLGVGVLGAGLGLGFAADNRRKDSVIATLKTPAPAANTPPGT